MPFAPGIRNGVAHVAMSPRKERQTQSIASSPNRRTFGLSGGWRAGELTDDEKLKREGTVDKAAGAAKRTVDNAADKAKEALDKK